MADALMKWETIDKDQIDDLMAGNEPRPPKEDEVIQPNMYNKQDKIDTNKVIKTNINKNKPAGQV
jgi:cell division protease FtsH